MTHYEVLSVSPKAPQEVIHAAWRALQKGAHPDSGGLLETAQRINEAHEVLSNPHTRAEYDAKLRSEQPRPQPINEPKPMNTEQWAKARGPRKKARKTPIISVDDLLRSLATQFLLLMLTGQGTEAYVENLCLQHPELAPAIRQKWQQWKEGLAS